MASGFWEAYRDPRWQKKRLEVMDAAQFRCQECKTDEVTLNVHHRFYAKGRKPWEYEIGDLVCLCEPCHESMHEVLTELKMMIGHLDPFAARDVAGYVKGQLLIHAANDGGNHSINLSQDAEGSYWPEACGLASAFMMIHDYASDGDPPPLLAMSDDGKIDFQTLRQLSLQSRQRHGVQFYGDDDLPTGEDVDQLLVACSG